MAKIEAKGILQINHISGSYVREVQPTLTLTYGLAWGGTVPPVEDKGKFMMTVLPSGSNAIVRPQDYLEQRRQAALAGQVFNPPVGFTPGTSMPSASRSCAGSRKSAVSGSSRIAAIA